MHKNLNKNSSRKNKAGELLRQIIADFICDYLSIPITISRVEVTKDLRIAEVFFVLPAIDAAYGVAARESVLRILPKRLLDEIAKTDQENTDKTSQLFLYYLDHIKSQIRMHIAKNAFLRATPNLFFSIEQESIYLSQNR